MGEVAKLSGDFAWGQNTDIAYFSQNHTESLNINNTVVERDPFNKLGYRP